MRAREGLIAKDNLGLNWVFMQANAIKFNKSIDGEDVFKASSPCIASALRRSDIVGVNVHGEARENTDE